MLLSGRTWRTNDARSTGSFHGIRHAVQRKRSGQCVSDRGTRSRRAGTVTPGLATTRSGQSRNSIAVRAPSFIELADLVATAWMNVTLLGLESSQVARPPSLQWEG